MKIILSLILILTLYSCTEEENLTYFKTYDIPEWDMCFEQELKLPIENIQNSIDLSIKIISDSDKESYLDTYLILEDTLLLQSNQLYRNGDFDDKDKLRGEVIVYFEL